MIMTTEAIIRIGFAAIDLGLEWLSAAKTSSDVTDDQLRRIGEGRDARLARMHALRSPPPPTGDTTDG